jgi:hypothetical protein
MLYGESSINRAIYNKQDVNSSRSLAKALRLAIHNWEISIAFRLQH